MDLRNSKRFGFRAGAALLGTLALAGVVAYAQTSIAATGPVATVGEHNSDVDVAREGVDVNCEQAGEHQSEDTCEGGTPATAPNANVQGARQEGQAGEVAGIQQQGSAESEHGKSGDRQTSEDKDDHD
jgi:hypothetical protein